jgi:hypothetical protein
LAGLLCRTAACSRAPAAPPEYLPSAPAYLPSTSAYLPSAPAYLPSAPAYLPSAPAYLPSAPAYLPSASAYLPSTSAYLPSAPAYLPSAPAYLPNAPAHLPSTPAYLPSASAHLPSAPAHLPSTPAHLPSGPEYLHSGFAVLCGIFRLPPIHPLLAVLTVCTSKVKSRCGALRGILSNREFLHFALSTALADLLVSAREICRRLPPHPLRSRCHGLQYTRDAPGYVCSDQGERSLHDHFQKESLCLWGAASAACTSDYARSSAEATLYAASTVAAGELIRDQEARAARASVALVLRSRAAQGPRSRPSGQ